VLAGWVASRLPKLAATVSEKEFVFGCDVIGGEQRVVCQGLLIIHAISGRIMVFDNFKMYIKR